MPVQTHNLLAHIFSKLMLRTSIPCSQWYLTGKIPWACGCVLLNIKQISLKLPSPNVVLKQTRTENCCVLDVSQNFSWWQWAMQQQVKLLECGDLTSLGSYVVVRILKSSWTGLVFFPGCCSSNQAMNYSIQTSHMLTFRVQCEVNKQTLCCFTISLSCTLPVARTLTKLIPDWARLSKQCIMYHCWRG